MAEALLTVSQFAAATLFLVLAVVLLAVKFNSRVNRAFAIFLLLRGVVLMLQAFGRLPSYADNQAFIFDTARYFALATPFVVLYFVVLYRSPRGGLGVRVAGITAVLGILVVESLYLLDHNLAVCRPGPECGAMIPLVQATPLAQGLAALFLAVSSYQLRGSPRIKSVIVVASAFALLGLLEGTQFVSLVISDGLEPVLKEGLAHGPWLTVSRVSIALAFVASAMAIGVLSSLLDHWRARLLLMATAVAVVVTTLVQLSLEDSEAASTQAATLTGFLFGTWRLLAAALVAYALVRHRFLDLDLRINWTISRGTVLAVFLATFLIVFQVVENYLDQRLGIVFGGLATGAMLLALRPLERLGDRVAASLHPRGRPNQEKDARLQLFQEQAMMVWADGVIGRKERLLLDNLRERLGIDIGVAARIEHEAAVESGVSTVPRGLSSRS